MSVITATAPEVTNGTKAPQVGAVREAVHEQLARDEQTIAQLQARIVVLEKNQKPATEKHPVTDSDLSAAILVMEKKNAASLKSESPKLDLSLAGQLGFVPILSEPQKKEWGPRRDAMRLAHTKAWKERSALVIAHLRRAVRLPDAQMGGSVVKRKSDGAVSAVSLRARNLAKKVGAKGHGKGAAKPAQPVAAMPKAPNANPPAQVK